MPLARRRAMAVLDRLIEQSPLRQSFRSSMSEDGSTRDAKSDAAGGVDMRPIARTLSRLESDDVVVSRREARWRRVYPDDGHDPELIVLEM